MPNPQPNQELGLALSGGGFRATLFHLGVVRALAEAGLLSGVTHITSVSGGSVLAAHLVLNWKAYNDSSKAFARAASLPSDKAETVRKEAAKLFDDASKPLLNFIDTDIRNRIIRRLPINLSAMFLARFTRLTVGALCGKTIYKRLRAFAESRRIVEQLGQRFEVLFGGKKLRDLAQPGAPRLIIMATEVASMQHAWFSSEGFTSRDAPSPVGPGILTVGKSVAASAAFPALFPPVRIDGEIFKLAGGLDSFVTDAGVYDNLGISGYIDKPFEGSAFPVLVSDATATSEWASTNIPNLLTNLLRSVDIMQQRAAHLQRDKVGLPQRDARAGNAAQDTQAQGRFILFDIAREDIRKEPMIGETAQQHVSYLRTDFDAFNNDEMRLLVHHGYAVAWHTLATTGHLPLDSHSHFGDWRAQWPRPVGAARDEEQAVEVLKEGRRSRLKFFVISDPVGVLNILVVVALLLLLPTAWLVEKHWRLEAERQRNAAETELRVKEEARAERERRKFAESRIDSFRNFSFPPKLPVQHQKIPSDLETNSYAGLTISAFEKMFDLRQWRPTNQLQVEPIEPALQQTVYTLRRESRATNVIFRLKTSGIGIMPEVPTLDAQLFQEIVPNERFPKHVLVRIDLTRIPENMEYPVIVRGTFWNGFQKPIEDASFKTYTRGDQGRMVILFPETRIPRRFTFFRILPNSTSIAPMPPPFHHFYKNGLYFEVDRPQLNNTYGVQFTWNDDGTGTTNQVTPRLSNELLAP